MNRPDRDLLIRLRSEILDELESLARLLDEFKGIDRSTAPLRLIGSILHDFYCAIERIFRRIAEELNGGVPEGRDWHVILLQDMTLELEGIRPAVLSRSLRHELEEYLRFRHLFRNVYGFTLRREKLQSLVEGMETIEANFRTEITTFTEFLRMTVASDEDGSGNS